MGERHAYIRPPFPLPAAPLDTRAPRTWLALSIARCLADMPTVLMTPLAAAAARYDAAPVPPSAGPPWPWAPSEPDRSARKLKRLVSAGRTLDRGREREGQTEGVKGGGCALWTCRAMASVNWDLGGRTIRKMPVSMWLASPCRWVPRSTKACHQRQEGTGWSCAHARTRTHARARACTHAPVSIPNGTGTRLLRGRPRRHRQAGARRVLRHLLAAATAAVGVGAWAQAGAGPSDRQAGPGKPLLVGGEPGSC